MMLKKWGMQSMIGKSVTGISIERKKEAVTLASKAAVKIDDECVQVDPQLIFQRLSLIAIYRGSLLDRLSWKQGETACLCKICVKYGEADGYDSDPDVKDATHQRRSHGSGPTVALTHQTIVTLDF